MTIPAWTFLISRNQSIDYTTIVAPDFISQAQIRSLLFKVTDDDFTENEQINIREVYGSEVGNFTVVFRSVKGRSKDIGEEGNEVLKDSFGREIYWVEGLVFQRSQKELLQTIGEIHLAQAHQELQEKYREFWHQDKLSVSHKIDLVETTSIPNNKLVKLDRFVITRQPNLIEPRTSKTPRNRPHIANKSISNKTDWFQFLMIAITVIVLVGIWGIWIHPSSANICLYETETFKFKSEPSPQERLLDVQNLQTLRDEHQTAWIWLSGDLQLKSSEIAEIKQKVADNAEKATLKAKDDQTLKMNYYPLNPAIAILKDKEFTSDNLTARIIESSSVNKSPQCSL